MAVQDKKNEQHYINNYNVSNWKHSRVTDILYVADISCVFFFVIKKSLIVLQYLKQTLTEGLNLIALNQGPFHYGSHYSNSGTVLHFLVRLPPFTGMFLCYQGSVP